MRRKLGLIKSDEGPEDDALAADLLTVMAETGADFTNTFRRLATFPMPSPTGKGKGDAGSSGAEANNREGAAETPAGSVSGSGAHEGGAGAPDLPYADGGFLAAQLVELASVEEMARGAAPRIPEANLQVNM